MMTALKFFAGLRRTRMLFFPVGLGLCVALFNATGSDARHSTKVASPGTRIVAEAPVVALDAAKKLHLVMAMKETTIYNPATGRRDKVDLRAYVARVGDSHSPLVGPTIEAVPGEHLKLGLTNSLPAEPDCNVPPKPHNTPHCFNTSNFHTHGLWVSPSGNSDNVLLVMKPGEHVDFEFDIPMEHPSGTFWYHPHKHGSTALQVGSGMSGALIVRGSRAPTAESTGDIDTLFAPIKIRERIVVFQQIQYACWDGDKIKTNPDGSWKCDANDVGVVKNYDQLGFDVGHGSERWTVSGRFTSINGDVLPTFSGATAGHIERWRMIHAGLANTISVTFRKMRSGAPAADRLSAVGQENWVTQNCSGVTAHQFAYAADGLTRSRIVERGQDRPTVLQPGYREDVLVAFPSAGTYCVIDEAAPAGESITTKPESRQLLATVVVGAGADASDQKAAIEAALVTSAQELEATGKYDHAVARQVIGDLKAGLKLGSFVPHRDLSEVTPDGRQQLAFTIGSGKFMVGTDIGDASKDKPYDPIIMDRVLKLGSVDEWTMKSRVASHPFHIHVNPFQIMKILDPKGQDVSESGEPSTGDMQYADLKGQWKDTILIKQGYTIVSRTKYERFVGKFVLHCHILDHEDQGMMENVEITTDGMPSPQSADPMKGM